jgi:hypothetical protein
MRGRFFRVLRPPTNRSAECQTNDIPAGGTWPNDMSSFNTAPASSDVGRFDYVVLNECEDGHANAANATPINTIWAN